MLIEDVFLYLVLVITGSAIGIPFGSWLNSKLLTRTWKGEINRVLKEATSSEEYKSATELVRNLNELLESEEAKNFFKNATKLLTQMTGASENTKPVFAMPPKKSSTALERQSDVVSSEEETRA